MRWPIKLDHISIDAKEKGLTGTGVLTQRHLRGHHSAMSGKIKHATTFIEFSPEGKPCRTDSSFLQRIMHPACRIFRDFTAPTDPSDDSFGLFCCHCDNCHARLFWDLQHNSLLKKNFLTIEYIKKRRDSSPDLKLLYTMSPDCSFNVNELDGRLFLEYDCPLLGFRELLFPVFFQDKVISVFFVGELTLASRKDFVEKMIRNIENRISSLKKNCPDCFLHRPIPSDTNLSQRLLDAHHGYVTNPPGESPRIILDSPENNVYEQIIKSVITELKSFEQQVLVDALQHEQHQYIRKTISDSDKIKAFAKATHQQTNQKQNHNRRVVDETPLNILWTAFESTLNHLVDSFDLRYAFAFGPGRIVESIASEDTLGIQAKSKNWEQCFTDEKNEPELAIKKLRFRIFPKPNESESEVDEIISFLIKDDVYTVCSPNDPKNLNNLYNDLLEGSDLASLGDYQMILLTVSPHPSNWLVILLGYPKSNDEILVSSLAEHKSSSYLHQNALKGFFTLVALTISSIRMAGLEELRKKQLLYLGHESGQLTAGLDWLQRTYKNVEKLEQKLKDDAIRHGKNVPVFIKNGLKKKIENLCTDIRGYSGLMYFVFDMAERLGDSNSLPKPEPSTFRPFGDVLAKWKDSYRYEAERSSMQINVINPRFYTKNGYRSRANDPWRPEMWADQFLFEMIVYNLVNNAEKYGHRGTKIIMDCKLASLDREAPFILTVTNYGVPIDPEDREIFEPFTRGKDTGNRTKGLGLGLFIVLNIVERIHSGKVTAICKVNDPISRFNVPLIQPYINRPIKDKNGDLIQKDENFINELKEEVNRLRSCETEEGFTLFESAVALDEEGEQIYDPEDLTILDEIKKPTYQVTLKVELPQLTYQKSEVKQ